MKVTFAPGPSQPYPHLQEYLQDALAEGIISISHRSARFASLFDETTEGLRSLLGDDQQELATRIDQQYASTRQQLAALQRPLGEMLADEAGRAELNAFYDNLNQIHRLQGGELAKVLGVQLGFNAHDGD